MSQYDFGTGILIGKRTDVANTPPFAFGVLQDVTIDFDNKLESLIGQSKVAVYLGDAELKITGKAKFARIQMSEWGNLFFGTSSFATSSSLDMVAPYEIGTPTSSSGSSYTVANSSSTPLADWGVFYASSGIQLNPVATASSVSSAGNYFFTSSGASSGRYIFSSSDNGTAMNFYYTFTASSGLTSINNWSNPLMGTSPLFQIWFKNTMPLYGVTKTTNLVLNACKSTKLSLPFSNAKFTIQELDFQAMADAANNVFSLISTE
jgi:hypothetical protein